MAGRRSMIAAGGAALGALLWRRLRRRELALDGKVVLVTGGSRGLGLLLAREFGRQGARLVICARDDLELDAARRDFAARGIPVLARRCDVARPDEVQALVRDAADRFGPVDLLVNNASIIQVGPLETMTLEDFQRAMAVNFWGTVHATFAVLPAMRARRAGRIVNITSIGARVSIPHLLPYGAAKFAVYGFSEGLRAELAGSGISVTTVVPGLMRTGSPVNATFKGRQAYEFAWFSLGDALPFTSMSAERAARRIVRAARRAEPLVTLSWQAKALRLGHDLFPGLTADVLGLVQRALPGPDGAGAGEVAGMELATPVSPSPLTGLMNRAARRLHQYAGRRRPTPEHARKVGLRESANGSPAPGYTDARQTSDTRI